MILLWRKMRLFFPIKSRSDKMERWAGTTWLLFSFQGKRRRRDERERQRKNGKSTFPPPTPFSSNLQVGFPTFPFPFSSSHPRLPRRPPEAFSRETKIKSTPHITWTFGQNLERRADDQQENPNLTQCLLSSQIRRDTEGQKKCLNPVHRPTCTPALKFSGRKLEWKSTRILQRRQANANRGIRS